MAWIYNSAQTGVFGRQGAAAAATIAGLPAGGIPGRSPTYSAHVQRAHTDSREQITGAVKGADRHAGGRQWKVWHERCFAKPLMDHYTQLLSTFWHRPLWPSLLASLLFFAAPALAGELQGLDSIGAAAISASEERARQQGYESVDVDVRPLDNRLRLPQCGQPLRSFIPPASRILGAVSVGVECEGPQPWTIYVRTQVSAQRAVPVLARALARNSVITAADIMLVNQPLEYAGEGIVFDQEQIIGMELTRSLNEGSTLRVRYLRAPKIIKRGQQVTLVSGSGGLEVRMQGKALTDAAHGERVSVATSGSGKTVEGIAHTDGSVHVP